LSIDLHHPALYASRHGRVQSEEQPEQILCPGCLAKNPPLAHFCTECGAPLSALSVIGPWERIQASGFAYREAVSGSPKKIILIGIWLLFFPGLVATAFWIGVMMPSLEGGGWRQLGEIAILGFACAVCIGILIRTTTNYLKKTKAPETKA